MADQLTDEFQKLPDDIITGKILTKIKPHDFEFLFGCTRISRRFKSLITQMTSVSISISPSPFLRDNDHPVSVYSQSVRPQIKNALTFLTIFPLMTSLEVVIITGENDEELREGHIGYGFPPSLINWKTKFGSKMHSSVFLFAQSVLGGAEQTEDVVIDDHTPEETATSCVNASNVSMLLGDVMLLLVVRHPELRNITIGSRNGAKICLTGDEITDLRNSLSPYHVKKLSTILISIHTTFNMKSAFLRNLHLPKSGYEMENVSLWVIRQKRYLYRYSASEIADTNADLVVTTEGEPVADTDDDSGSDYSSEDCEKEDAAINHDDTDILEWEFESEEEVFGEAVTLVLENHREDMHLRQPF